MSKKAINVDSITNELAGASLFFNNVSPPLVDMPRAEPILDPEKTRQLPTSPDDVIITKHTIMPDSMNASMQASTNTIHNDEPKEISKPNPIPETSNSDSREVTSEPAITPDSPTASMQASTQIKKGKDHDYIETIRKSVKQVGKEILFVRLTPEEKSEVTSIVYAFNEQYRGNGRKTSENEFGRIAVNYLIAEYRKAGQQSILARVLAALNA